MNKHVPAKGRYFFAVRAIHISKPKNAEQNAEVNMNLNVKTITAENSRWIAGSQILVEGILGIPGRVRTNRNNPGGFRHQRITESRIEEGKILLRGIAYFKVLYLNTEGEFSGFDAEMSFYSNFGFYRCFTRCQIAGLE